VFGTVGHCSHKFEMVVRTRAMTKRKRRARARRPDVGLSPNMASMLNPLFPNHQPKIPDGSQISSLGRRFVTTRPIQMLYSATNPKPVTIVLYPGFNSCAFAFDSFPGEHMQKVFKYQGAPTLNGRLTPGEVVEAPPSPRSLLVYQDNINRLAKWRGVSFGMKVMLINNSESNDGWWEAMHIPSAESPSEYSIKPLDNDSDFNDTAKNCTVIMRPQNHAGTVMSDQPSYQQGKLRNIHNHTFVLSTINQVHPHIDLTESWKVDADTAIQPHGHAIVPTGDANENAFTNCMMDKSFGAILLRIHGRPPISDQTGGSMLQVTTYANVEHVYDEGSLLAQFQTYNRAVRY